MEEKKSQEKEMSPEELRALKIRINTPHRLDGESLAEFHYRQNLRKDIERRQRSIIIPSPTHENGPRRFRRGK